MAAEKATHGAGKGTERSEQVEAAERPHPSDNVPLLTGPSRGADTAKSTEASGRTEARVADARMDETGMPGLDQIREILFGAAQREFDRRLARADAHLSARLHELEQETRRRMDVLEAHLRKELEALANRVTREAGDAAETFRKMSKEHREAISHLEQQNAKIQESGLRAQRELREQLLEQAKSFLDELQRSRKELLAILQQELGIVEGELTEELREPENYGRH